MKKIRAHVAYVVILVIVAVIVCPANIWAQSSNTLKTSKQVYFDTAEGCLEALKDGTAEYYRPTYFKLHRKAGPGEEVRKLESDACVRMKTIKGNRFYVAQKEGEEMVFKGREIDRRYDCGNPIYDIRYPKTDEPEPKPSPTPTVEKPKPCPAGTYPSEEPGVCIKDVPGETPKPIDNTCKPGGSNRILDFHEKKGFNPIEIIKQKLDAKTAGRILALMVITENTQKVTSLVIYSNGCDYAVWAHSVIQKGLGWWKWVIPIAIAAAFLAGWFLRGGSDCKDCLVTPVKSTPPTGSPTPIRIIRY